MKVLQQETEFKPVAIILETRDELEAMWQILDDHIGRGPSQDLAVAICNRITNEVKS